MTREVITVDAEQQLPEFWDAFILVAGPDSSSSPWHAEVIASLQKGWMRDGRLVVFLSEPGCTAAHVVTEETINRREQALHIADVVLFWWPDDTDLRLMSASLTAWNDRRRVVCGTQAGTVLSNYLIKYGETQAVSTVTTLAALASAALNKISAGGRRAAGERDVPLGVWRTASFQRWYSAQVTAGNTLLSARLVWTFGAGPGQQESLMYWALHVRMWVQAEKRVKSNEVVISRPDISVMALYLRGATIDDTIIVLVREFRSPASTPDGLVHELPGGSTAGTSSPLDQAITEIQEETGFTIDIDRVRSHGSRQLAATMSAHHAHLFAAEITSDELSQLRESQTTSYGVGGTELTWVEIATFGELRQRRLVDWSTLGMITEAVLRPSSLPGP